MSKENLAQRIAFQKQQIISAQNAEVQRLEAERLACEESKRLALINEQREEVEKTAATRKMFEGSGIVETLEEIRDSGLLKYGDDPVRDRGNKIPVFKSGFLGRQVISHYEDKIISPYTPAKISYNLNTVSLHYDYWFSNAYDNIDSNDGDSVIYVKKIDSNTFELAKSFYIKEKTITGNAQIMIDNIARVVAENQIRKQAKKIR